MKIAAIARCSLVDYPGKTAAVVFTQGCNLDCFYCHNRTLLTFHSPTRAIPLEDVLKWLRKRQGLLDAVVISGGEPTLQPGLTDFIRRVRAMGYAAKLDTNGTHPRILATLIEEDLLNYVAIDIKAPSEKYETICGVPMNHGTIDQSIDLLMNGCIDYEFRTTVVPQLTEADILAIGRHIRGARSYVLQQYRRPEPVPGFTDPRLGDPSHSMGWTQDILAELSGLVMHRGARGFDIKQLLGAPPS